MKDYVVFSISSNKKLAKDFAKFWNCPLGKVGIDKFADGETLVKSLTDVKGKDVLIIESTAKKPNERLFQLLLLLDSVNRGEAKSVELVIPYLGYSRQEKSTYQAEPISCEVMAKVLETGKYDRLMTLDLHNPVIESFFQRGIKNISTSDMFANYFSTYLSNKGYDFSDVVIVSPDHGSSVRADGLVYRFRGSRRVVLEKSRPEKDKVEHLELSGDVTGKVCIIIDDIISTGQTIASASKLLYKKGAKEVIVGATHGVFSKDAVELLKKARVKLIAVTNSIEQEEIEGVKVLDILQLIIQNI